ncbi:unnamed protein product [Closterium sp. NIES-65]|nr:unnamed protein product [Closterium sp. NIES-65]
MVYQGTFIGHPHQPLRESEEGKGEEAEGRGSSDSVDGGEGDEFMETGGLEILARWVGVRTAVSSENSQKQQWQCGVDGGEGDEFRETGNGFIVSSTQQLAPTKAHVVCCASTLIPSSFPPFLHPHLPAAVGSSGSGFIVSSVQWLVLTNAHVVDGAARVTVRGLLLPDGRRFATQSTALHPSADLAMLKVTHRLHTKGPPAGPLSSLQGVEEPAVARVKSELDVARVKSELAIARVKSELAVARVKSELAVARVKSELAVARVKSELAVARVKSELAVARVKSELAVARVKSELAVARVKSELAVARVKSELAVARVKSELAVAEEEGTGWSAADSVGSAKERATVHGCRGGGSREGVGEGLIKGEWDENSSVAVIFGEARGGEQERGGERGGKGDGEEGERQGDGGERGGGQRDGREEGAGNREEEWLPCAPIGDNDDVELADRVISVGNPVGLPGSISLGVISSLHRTAGQVNGSAPLLAALLRTSCAINPESFPPFSPSPQTLTPSSFLSIFRHPSHQVGVPHSSLHFFQTDCAINPGRSGSPLVNEF